MSPVRALRTSAAWIAPPAATWRGLVALAAMGLAGLGCRVFSPGLAPPDDSGYSSPDGISPVPESAAPEDAQPLQVTESLYGPAWIVGCSDGTREGFRDLDVWPSIAGCAGSWRVPGLPTSFPPPRPCSGESGNTSANTFGFRCLQNGTCTACSVADLCAVGWHPCLNGKEVSDRSPTGCEQVLSAGEVGLFIAMAGASADGVCDRDERNDLHGCGNLGSPESEQCPPFIRRMGFADCENTGSVWQCGNSSQRVGEANEVTKLRSDLGGILCCKDP